MGRMTIQQFYNKNMAPSQTALLPKAIRLLRQIVIKTSKTPVIISPLPKMMRELYDSVESVFCGMNELISIPFACRINSMPISYIPTMHTNIVIQITTPVQHLTKHKKSIEATIDKTAAPNKICHPTVKSNAQALRTFAFRCCAIS